MLVLQDVLKSTPEGHPDLPSLQEALRLSRSFLHGLNESSQSTREVTLSHGVVSFQNTESRTPPHGCRCHKPRPLPLPFLLALRGAS